MSCYNEYLHHDFKELGFPDYIKMLDGESRVANLNFLTTHEKLPEPPFFGKYSADIKFTIVNPSEETGKRPYIGLIQSTVFEASRGDNEPGMIHQQIYYPPFPEKRMIKQDITRSIEKIVRDRIAVATSQPAPDFIHPSTYSYSTSRHARR
jgi:hypothetical protein